MFPKEVSIGNFYFSVSVGSYVIEKKFVFIRAFAVFRNQLELLPEILSGASADKAHDEIIRHFFNLKLDTHCSPPSQAPSNPPNTNHITGDLLLATCLR